MESTATFILLLFATSVLSITDNFFFNGFQQASNLSLDGCARITSNGVLQLTNDTEKVISHAFFSSPFYMLQNRHVLSFSTTFVFDIITIENNGGGHGFTFALSPSKTLTGSESGGYLGLLGRTNNGNFSNHVFAVEFDTFQGTLFNGIDDNHVGIDINSLVSNASKPASYFQRCFALGPGIPQWHRHLSMRY